MIRRRRGNNFKKAITEMRACYEVFPRVLRLTLNAGGNNKTNKAH